MIRRNTMPDAKCTWNGWMVVEGAILDGILPEECQEELHTALLAGLEETAKDKREANRISLLTDLMAAYTEIEAHASQ